MDITNSSNLRDVSKVSLNPFDKGERQVALNAVCPPGLGTDDSSGMPLSQMFAVGSFYLCESALICVLTSDSLPYYVSRLRSHMSPRPDKSGFKTGAFVYGGSDIL